MDITSLNNVIPNDEGLQALKHFFNQCTVKEPCSETKLCLAKLVITLNYSSFDVNYYKQTNGVAMGTKMGASHTSLCVCFIKQQFFTEYISPKPEPYSCYNNNCISTTSSIREELTSFVTADQFLSPSYEISNTPLAFLDLKISLEGNGLGATVYHKPTESHSCFSPSFKVRSSFQTNDQPGTFKCTHSQYKTLSFIHTVKKMSGSKRSLKNHWSLHVYPHECHLLLNVHQLQKVVHWWNRKTTKWAIPRQLCNAVRNDKDASKPVTKHINLPNNSKQHIAVSSHSLHLGSSESH